LHTTIEIWQTDGSGEAVKKSAKMEKRKKLLECDIKLALRADIERLEAGLRITDGGKEQMVKYGGTAEPGWIDITAEDKKGHTVVIELKRGKAGRRAVGQILGYMGALMDDNKQIRGILVAKKFSPQGRAAARPAPRLQLTRLQSLHLKQMVASR
jgi:endonuclease